MYSRYLKLLPILTQRSCFLFGPRQTGKSTLIESELKGKAQIIDLLDSDLFLSLNSKPSRLREMCEDTGREIVVIDEIQKAPLLLNEVHLLIQRKGLKFLLTGSSAKRLRQRGVNLLGGRAHEMRLYPLTSSELAEDFDLNKALSFGTLPPVVASAEPLRDLEAYCTLYLTQEIQAEGYVRSLPAFSRFLEVAALSNSGLINYSKIANDAQVPPNTVREHFQILRDTLIGQDLEPWRKSKTRKAVSTAKFYFFDIGVARTLQGRKGKIQQNSRDFGEAFESLIAQELFAYCSYNFLASPQFWRTDRGLEVDFLVGNRLAVEVKATTTVSKEDLKGLKALQDEKAHKHYVLVCLEPFARLVDGIRILPIEEFLERLWKGEFV